MEVRKEIYIIRNTVNKKVYIGQTKVGYKSRYLQHTSKAINNKNGSPKLYNAMRKHGIKNFYVELLEDNIPEDAINTIETKYIKEYDAVHSGYNVLHEGGSKAGYLHSEETLAKMRASAKPPSQETRDKMRRSRISRDKRVIICVESKKQYSNPYTLADILGVPTSTVTKVCKNLTTKLNGKTYVFKTVLDRKAKINSLVKKRKHILRDVSTRNIGKKATNTEGKPFTGKLDNRLIRIVLGLDE